MGKRRNPNTYDLEHPVWTGGYFAYVREHPAAPVILFTIGQLFGDVVPPIESAPLYSAVVPLIKPANPVIQIRIGQLLGDKLEPIDAPPHFYKQPSTLSDGKTHTSKRTPRIFGIVPPIWTGGFFTFNPITAPPADANPVVLFSIGQLLQDQVAPIESVPRYGPTIQDYAQFPASPVILLTIGQWLGDIEPPPDFAVQARYYTPVIKEIVTEAQPVIPYRRGQLLSDDILPPDDFISKPYYIKVPARKAERVIPHTIGQWLGDVVAPPDFAVKSRFWDVIQPQSNRIIPIAIGQWLGDKLVHPYFAAVPQFITEAIQPQAQRVIPIIVGQWLGDEVAPPDFAVKSFYIKVPARKTEAVVPYRIGQLLSDVVPPAFMAIRPYFVVERGIPEALPVIEYAIGQWIGDKLEPVFQAIRPYFTVERGELETFPVIPFTIGQLQEDVVPPLESVPVYGPVGHVKASHVPDYAIGQLRGDKLLDIDSKPYHYKYPIASDLAPLAATPVIPIRTGQLISDAVPDIDSKPYFYGKLLNPAVSVIATPVRTPKTLDTVHPVWTGGFFSPPRPPLPTNAVIEPIKGQWISDELVFPVLASSPYFVTESGATKTFPVIPFSIGQLVSDDVAPIESLPSYGPVGHVKASPVIPISRGQWLGDELVFPALASRPYFVTESGATKTFPVIPFSIGQLLGDELPFPLQASSPYFVTESGAPKTFRVIPFSIGQLVEDVVAPIDSAPSFGPVGHVKASHVPDPHVGQWLGDKVLEIDSAPYYYGQILSDLPPIAASPVIPFFTGQLLEDTVPPIESVPQYLPTIQDYAQFPASAVIEYAVGQLLEDDVAPVFMPLRPYFVTESGAPKTFRVIEYNVGQLLEDVLPPIDSAPKYGPVVRRKAERVIPFTIGQLLGDKIPFPLQASSPYFVTESGAPKTFPVIPLSKGQLISDELPPFDAFAQYYGKLLNPPVEQANIAFAIGQLLSDATPPLESTPFYYEQPSRIEPVADTNAVIEYVVGQWISDAVEPIESLPVYSAVIQPQANLGIPISIGQWVGADVEPIDSAPYFYTKPERSTIAMASPVIAPVVGQWLGDAVLPIDSKPYFYQYIPLTKLTNPVIGYSIGQIIEPVPEIHYGIPGRYTFVAQNLDVIVWQDYECLRQIHQSKIASTTTYTFFAVLRRVGAEVAKARLFSIDDAAEVAGSVISTTSTSFVIVESGAITLSGNKEYKAQAGVTESSEIRMLGAWVEGNPT